MPAWLLDLLHSALGSLAANGLACGLLVFGAHQPSRWRVDRAKNADKSIVGEPLTLEPLAGAQSPTDLTIRKRVINKKKHAAQFALEALWPTEIGGCELSTVHRAYCEWCGKRGIEPLAATQIGLLLADIFDGVGISITEREGKLMAMGISLRSEEWQLPH